MLQEVKAKHSRLTDLQCELTALKIKAAGDERPGRDEIGALSAAERSHKESQELLKSTLEDQLHENGQLREQLEAKREECGQLTVRSEQLWGPKRLTQQVVKGLKQASKRPQRGFKRLLRSSELKELRGFRAMLPQVKEELAACQRNEVAVAEQLESMLNQREDLEMEVQRLKSMAQQQKKDIEKYRSDLKRESGVAEAQRLELLRTQKDLRESRAEVRNLTGSMVSRP